MWSRPRTLPSFLRPRRGQRWPCFAKCTSHSSNQIPYTRVRKERQAVHRNPLYELARRLKDHVDQLRVFREEENVPHQGTGGVRSGNRIDPIFGPFGEKIKTGDRSRQVLP